MNAGPIKGGLLGGRGFWSVEALFKNRTYMIGGEAVEGGALVRESVGGSWKPAGGGERAWDNDPPSCPFTEFQVSWGMRLGNGIWFLRFSHGSRWGTRS